MLHLWYGTVSLFATATLLLGFRIPGELIGAPKLTPVASLAPATDSDSDEVIDAAASVDDWRSFTHQHQLQLEFMVARRSRAFDCVNIYESL